MKRTKLLRKSLCALSAAAVMLMSGMTASAESEYKVYDYGNLLSDDEAYELETRLEEIAEEYNQDVIVYTADSMDGYSAESYSELLADKLNAGINGSGIIYLVAMGEREYDIYAFGQMYNEIMTDGRRDALAQELQPYLTDGEYYAAFTEYADSVSAEINHVYTYGANESGGAGERESYAVPAGIIGGLIVALVTVLIMRGQMNTLKSKPMANEYIRKGGFSLDRARDIFLYSTVTRTRIESDSSAHSHSGSFHSGGGGGGHSSGHF